MTLHVYDVIMYLKKIPTTVLQISHFERLLDELYYIYRYNLSCCYSLNDNIQMTKNHNAELQEKPPPS